MRYILVNGAVTSGTNTCTDAQSGMLLRSYDMMGLTAFQWFRASSQEQPERPGSSTPEGRRP